ncbi:MAG: zinc finger domain-containing protein [Candidatus Altarchaeaceae archaeon]
MICQTCGRETNEVTRFPCPNCGETEIIRCKSCRILGRQYTCPKCGFTGP